MSAPALRVSGLVRRFGGRAAVDGLDLEVQPGDLYGFLGPNGAGKTTAIRCMLGLIAKDAGSIEIFGERDPVAQRRHVGAMVETPAFHEWLSAQANLELACAYAGQGGVADIEQALQRVGLWERRTEAVRGYSLGMKQRLGIARALVARPKLLILDEPTNGLDPRGMREVRDLLRDLVYKDGLTVFLSSHLLGEVQAICTRVGILDAGKRVAEGRVQELIRHQEINRVEIGAKDRDRLLAAVQSLPVRVAGEGEAGRVLLDLFDLDVPGLNRALVSAGVEVEALIPVTASLESLYLSVTTREVR